MLRETSISTVYFLSVLISNTGDAFPATFLNMLQVALLQRIHDHVTSNIRTSKDADISVWMVGSEVVDVTHRVLVVKNSVVAFGAHVFLTFGEVPIGIVYEWCTILEKSTALCNPRGNLQRNRDMVEVHRLCTISNCMSASL